MGHKCLATSFADAQPLQLLSSKQFITVYVVLVSIAAAEQPRRSETSEK